MLLMIAAHLNRGGGEWNKIHPPTACPRSLPPAVPAAWIRNIATWSDAAVPHRVVLS